MVVLSAIFNLRHENLSFLIFTKEPRSCSMDFEIPGLFAKKLSWLKREKSYLNNTNF